VKPEVRAVLVGCGGISGAWLRSPSLKKRVEIVGLVDIRRAAALDLKKKFALDNAVVDTDLNRALKTLKPDVVFDCTVPEAHKSVVLAALRHGCHVLGEKPLADTMANARAMVSAARRARRAYAVIQNRRYQPEIRAIRQAVASGAIGRLTTVQSNFFVGAHFGGFRDRMKHVLLLDMAIHTFDAARFLTGGDAEDVYCSEWNPAGSWYAHGASALAVFTMTGGIVYSYQGSWCSEGCRTTWESDWRIIGTKGTILWDGASCIRAEAASGDTGFFRDVSRVKIPVKPLKRVGHDGVIGNFLDSLKTGAIPETAAADNIRSLAMVHAAIRSAGVDRRVKV